MKYAYYIGAIALVVLALASMAIYSNTNTFSDTQTDITPEASFSHAHGMAVDVADPGKLYIATHQGLYMLQNDKDLYRVGEMRSDLMGFSAHPTQALVFYSSGHPRAGGAIGFQKTVDGGITWTKVSDGANGPVDFHAMAVSTVYPSLIYGYYNQGLQRSLDEGKTWEVLQTNIQPLSLTTDSQKESIVYAATHHGVYVSEDKGLTWNSLSPELEGGAASVLAVQPDNNSSMLVFSEKLGGMGKSIDGGQTWQKIPAEFGGGIVMYLSYSPSQPGTVYAITHQNSIFKSIDGGDTWLTVR